MGLRILLFEEKIHSTLGSDSQLMIESWSKGHVTAQTFQKMDKRKKEYIKECVELRKKLERQLKGKIIKVPGSSNPSDIGFHK